MYFEKDKKYIVLDVEGNSASKEEERRITQFSALLICNDSIEEIDLMNRNVNYISSYVRKMTHISIRRCKRLGLSERHLTKEIHSLLEQVDKVYAYGMDFDHRIINYMFKKYKMNEVDVKWHDIINDVKEYLPVSRTKLDVASKEMGFEMEENEFYHNALVDCHATLFLMNKIEEKLNG